MNGRNSTAFCCIFSDTPKTTSVISDKSREDLREDFSREDLAICTCHGRL